MTSNEHLGASVSTNAPTPTTESALDRDRLLGEIAERIRTRMDDRTSRRYLSVMRIGQRQD